MTFDFDTTDRIERELADTPKAVREQDWEKVEAAIWPNGPAHGHGSGVYAAHKARVQAEIARLREAGMRIAADLHGAAASEGFHPLITMGTGMDDDWLRCPHITCVENRAALAPGGTDGEHFRQDDELLAEAVRLRAALARADQWIISLAPFVPDHACGKCVPGGPIVDPDFLCVFHEAKARAPKEAS